MTNKYLKRYINKFLNDVKKHNKDYYELIKEKVEDYNLSLLQELILLIIQELSFLGKVRRRYLFPLCQCILYGIANRSLTFISINSSALTKDKNKLREKPQYRKIKDIDDELKKIQRKIKISINYLSILPDYSKDYPISDYDTAWEKNKKYLEKLSLKKAYRFSELLKADFSSYEKEIIKNINFQYLNEEITYYTNNPFIVLGFSAKEDFQKNQIYNYLFVGAMLEKVLPFSILLDVQKKNFPFEQKFYNYIRKHKLPIIFCGQKFN